MTVKRKLTRLLSKKKVNANSNIESDTVKTIRFDDQQTNTMEEQDVCEETTPEKAYDRPGGLDLTSIDEDSIVSMSDSVDAPKWATEGSDFSIWECMQAITALLLIGSVAFSFVFEQWPIADSMYFTIVTLTTVGYGDLHPTTAGGYLFMSLYTIIGVSIIGIALGVIGNDIISAQIESNEDKKKRHDSAILSTKKDASLPNAGKTFTSILSGRTLINILLCAFLFGGARFLFHGEQLSLIQTIYFIVVTATTTGYGDECPSTSTERLFAVIYILVAVGVMGEYMGNISGYIIEKRQQKLFESMKDHEFNFDDLQMMDTDQSGEVSELEYVIFMLKSMNKVDDELLNSLQAKFKEWDVTGDGSLSVEDLRIIANRNKFIRRSVKTTPKNKLNKHASNFEGSDVSEIPRRKMNRYASSYF